MCVQGRKSLTTVIRITKQNNLYGLRRRWRSSKEEPVCFHAASHRPNSIPPNNDQVPIIATGTSYSSSERHSGSSSQKWDEMRTEGETIMFLSSKLCLLMALLLGWLLMDITFHAVPQATVWSSAFSNEQLCDAPLKLVQRSIIHHLQHCQRVTAMSPCLPVTIGLQERLSPNSQCGAMYAGPERWQVHLHFSPLHSGETTAPRYRCYFRDSFRRSAAVRLSC